MLLRTWELPPHARRIHPGAYQVAVFSELPPRARRILAKVMNWLDEKGTTSACAENTVYPWDRHGEGWNYLRVRGEYPDQG